MTEKSLEEEVAELERLYKPTQSDEVTAPLALSALVDVGRTIPRLIADWRKRGERIEEARKAMAAAYTILDGEYPDYQQALERLRRELEK